MRTFSSFAFAACLSATLLACGGGSSPMGGGDAASKLTLSGTAATGLAIVSAPVSAKCQTGSGTATTGSDGNYQLTITSGTLPCVLEVAKPDGSGTLHSVATGTGLIATANITPLTEMVTAKLVGSDPASFFTSFVPSRAADLITSEAVQTAQTAVVTALSGTLDASKVPSLITTPLRAATATNLSGGDAQDQLLDSLKTKLTSAQQALVVAAFANNLRPDVVQTLVRNSATANLSQLTSTLNLETNTLVLSWSDSFPSGTTYRVELQNADGSFGLVETLAGVGGGGTAMQWQRAVTVSASYRVVAVVAGSNVLITTPQGQDRVSVVVPSAPTTIVSSVTEPVSGTTTLSLSGTNAYSSVSWYVDLRLIGTTKSTGVNDKVGNPIAWNTSAETNATHLILARVQTATDSYTEVRRTLSIANSNLALSASVSSSTGTINIDASASSQYGIARVEGSFDGAVATSLTDPNACTRFCSTNNIYRFSVSAAAVGSGSHSMVITAIDKQGARKSVTVSVPISNMPIITLTSPADGALVNGSLVLTGTSSSDKAGAVTTTASLGDYQFLNTTNANFTGTMSLSSLPAGSYTLTVKATDSSKTVTILQRTVSVASIAALAYTPLLELGAGSQLLAAKDEYLLYRSQNGEVRLRIVTAGTEVVLSGDATATRYLQDWQISNGHVFANGKGADCFMACVYQWTPQGTMKNLSNSNPYSASPSDMGGRAYDRYAVAHDGFVIWVSDQANTASQFGGSGWYTLYDIAKGTAIKISAPEGSEFVGNSGYDFYVESNGQLSFYYWARYGFVDISAVFDLFRWSSATNTSTKLSSGNTIRPKTDGSRWIWQQTTSGGTGAITLLSQPLEGGSRATLTSSAGNYVSRDGVTAWLETSTSTGGSRLGGTVTTVTGLKAISGNGTVTTISSVTGVNLYAVSGGNVIFGEAGKVYSWNSTTKQSKLLLETAPTQIIAAGKTIYFVMGTTQVLYKILID